VAIRSIAGRQAALFSVLLALTASFGSACQSGQQGEARVNPQQPLFHSATFVGNVQVAGDTVPGLPDQDRLDAMFLGLLRSQQPWAAPESSLPVTHELLTTIVNDANHSGAVIVVLAWSAQWRPDGADNVQIQLEIPYDHDRDGFLADPERALGSDLEHFADAVSSNVSLRAGTDAEVTAALQTPDERTIELALREAARRQLADVAPLVRPLISHASDSIALAAMGTSAVLGDSEAIRLAIVRCESVDDDFLIAALPAIDRMGGEESELFLRALAEGHRSLEVRVRAQGLLAN
jgi:hypothetical protein